MPPIVSRALTPWLHSREYVDRIEGALADMDARNIRQIALDGLYDLTESLAVPSNCEIQGDSRNGATVRVPAGATFPAFDVDGKTGVQIRNLQGAKASGAALSSRGYLVWIHGNGADALVEDVLGDGFVSTVQVGYGPTGSADGTVERVVLNRVTALNSPTLYGICFDNVETATIDTCFARGNWLDGLKLRKMATYVTITGGEYAENGASGAGDGLDAYAGGDTLAAQGVVFRANTGNGCTIKQADGTDTASYGYVKNMILTGCRFVANAGIGLYMPAASDTSIPMVATVQVDACLADGNTGPSSDGFYNGARNATFTNCVARNNDRYGFLDNVRAIDSAYIGCRAIANGRSSAGTYDGFSLGGHGGTVVGCRAIGVDADTVTAESDYAALTKYHVQGFRVTSAATGKWRVRDCESTYHTGSGSGIRTDLTSGVCVIDQEIAGNPSSVGAYGSLGSRAVDTTNGRFYGKTSGAPNAPLVGWQAFTLS